MIVDPIADLLTRVRNGQMAGHRTVIVRKSKMAERVLEVLKTEGFISAYGLKKREGAVFEDIEVELKYYGSGEPVISSIKRASRCGRRQYVGVQDIPKIHCGLGVAILSTSKGLMSDRQARKNSIGGELIATVA